MCPHVAQNDRLSHYKRYLATPQYKKALTSTQKKYIVIYEVVNLKIYKSSLFIIVKNAVYGVLGGAVIAFFLNIFLLTYLAVIIGAVISLLIVYFAAIGDNIRVVIDGDTFTVYRRGKVKHSFNMCEVSLEARIKNRAGDCILMVTEQNGESTRIDCSMLGQNRFYRLLEDLKVVGSDPV